MSTRREIQSRLSQAQNDRDAIREIFDQLPENMPGITDDMVANYLKDISNLNAPAAKAVLDEPGAEELRTKVNAEINFSKALNELYTVKLGQKNMNFDEFKVELKVILSGLRDGAFNKDPAPNKSQGASSNRPNDFPSAQLQVPLQHAKPTEDQPALGEDDMDPELREALRQIEEMETANAKGGQMAQSGGRVLGNANQGSQGRDRNQHVQSQSRVSDGSNRQAAQPNRGKPIQNSIRIGKSDIVDSELREQLHQIKELEAQNEGGNYMGGYDNNQGNSQRNSTPAHHSIQNSGRQASNPGFGQSNRSSNNIHNQSPQFSNRGAGASPAFSNQGQGNSQIDDMHRSNFNENNGSFGAGMYTNQDYYHKASPAIPAPLSNAQRSPRYINNAGNSGLLPSHLVARSGVDPEMDDLMRQIEELQAQQSVRGYGTQPPPALENGYSRVQTTPSRPDVNASAFAGMLGDNMGGMLNTQGIADLIGSAMHTVTSPENQAAMEQKKLHELQEQLSYNESILNPLKIDVATLEQQNIRVKSNLKGLRNTHTYIREDIERLNSECDQKELEKETLEKDVEALQAELDKIEQDILYTREGLVLNEDPLMDMRIERNSLKEDLQNLDIEIEKYKSSYESVKNKWIIEISEGAGVMEKFQARAANHGRDLSPNVFDKYNAENDQSNYTIHADLSKYSMGTPRSKNTTMNADISSPSRMNFSERVPRDIRDYSDYSTSRSVSRSPSPAPKPRTSLDDPEMLKSSKYHSAYANKYLNQDFSHKY